ncbi:MAG: hypothetical protein ACRD3E_16645 [Terriglobales bacterium]
MNADTIQFSLASDQKVDRELPSFLGSLIVFFSEQSLSEYGKGGRRPVPPEVSKKVEHNDLPVTHRVLTDWTRHAFVLEKAYEGVEQQNADARYLVRRKASVAYETLLPTDPAEKLKFVRANAGSIVERVIAILVEDYKKSTNIKVAEEIAHLAVSLVVADAVIECEVLEKP